MKFRFWMSYTSRNGKHYGRGIADSYGVHVRGWHAGVKVTPRVIASPPGSRKKDRDAFDVYLTYGSDPSGGHDGLIGRVEDTPDGPRFKPADGYSTDLLLASVYHVPAAE
jgi:hypothetical protein